MAPKSEDVVFERTVARLQKLVLSGHGSLKICLSSDVQSPMAIWYPCAGNEAHIRWILMNGEVYVDSNLTSAEPFGDEIEH